VKRPKPFEDKEVNAKKTYTKRKKKKAPKRKPKPKKQPSPVEEVEFEVEEEKSEEQQLNQKRYHTPIAQDEPPRLQTISRETPPAQSPTSQPITKPTMDKVIRRLEADFHNLSLKQVNSIVIRDLLKSSEEDCIYFGRKLCDRTYILDALITKMIDVLNENPVAQQMKNVGVLHKLIKGLQRLVGTGAECVFSDVFQQKLTDAAKIEGLPVKTVKRITDLLGTIINQDYQNPEPYMKELAVPVDQFPGVDWPETILGPYGEKRVEFEDKFGVRIRVRGHLTEYKPDQPMSLLIRSIQTWNVEFAWKALEDFMNDTRNHKPRKDGVTPAMNVWKQVLDTTTKAHYYWNQGTNEVRWEAPSEGFTPVGGASVGPKAPSMTSI